MNTEWRRAEGATAKLQLIEEARAATASKGVLGAFWPWGEVRHPMPAAVSVSLANANQLGQTPQYRHLSNVKQAPCPPDFFTLPPQHSPAWL
jgi:hypothetical protein